MWKTTRNKKKRHNKTVILAKSKLNSIKSEIYEAPINDEIIHQDFVTIINEQKNYQELRESIRIRKIHWKKKSDWRRQKKGIDDTSRKMYKYKTMLSYSLT